MREYLQKFYVVSYFEFLQDLEKRVDQDWEGIASSLNDIRKSLLSRKSCLINVTAEGKNLTNSLQYLDKFVNSLPNIQSIGSGSWQSQLSPVNEAIVIPTQVKYLLLCVSFNNSGSPYPSTSCPFPYRCIFLQVNYVGKAGNIYETGYKLHGSAYVISKHISNTWLWDRVRVSGGAYGGFCDFDTHSGKSLLLLVLAD